MIYDYGCLKREKGDMLREIVNLYGNNEWQGSDVRKLNVFNKKFFYRLVNNGIIIKNSMKVINYRNTNFYKVHDGIYHRIIDEAVV